MIIRRIWWQPYRVPYRAAITTANASEAARDGVILGIETHDGRFGCGEAAPLLSYAGGTIAETVRAVAEVAERSVGTEVRHLWSGLSGLSGGAEAATRCGLETAAADLLAQYDELSLSHWLGRQIGTPPSAIVAAVAVNGLIDAVSPSTAGRQARVLALAGFGTVKVKVGRDDEVDERRVAAVRKSAGPSVAIRIDPNGSWTHDEAGMRLERYRLLGASLCEQPISHLRPAALAELARVRERSIMDIAADESCRSGMDLFNLITSDAMDVVVIKPMITGLREALAMLEMATANAVPVIITTTFEAGIGTAAAIHLAALLGPDAPACGLATLDRLQDDLVIAAPTVADGFIAVPPQPGLGVQLDEAALARYATGPRQEATR